MESGVMVEAEVGEIQTEDGMDQEPRSVGSLSELEKVREGDVPMASDSCGASDSCNCKI